MEKMTVLDLFSGIGGFSLGLERAGMETIAFCEVDPFCKKVLKKHWPKVPIFHDIKELSYDKLPTKPRLVCGGYPCQPFSQAGKRRGKKDDRYLWPEMFRIVKECRPAWVVCENVFGHIDMGLDTTLFNLESEGYTTQTFIIPACAVNALHRRDRVWVVGYSDKHGLYEATDSGKVKREVQESKKKQSLNPPRTSRPGNNSKMGKGLYSPNATYPSCLGLHDSKTLFSRVSLLQGEIARNGQAIKIITNKAEPGIRGVANGVPDWMDRIKALGNAVVPQIVELIGRCIIAIEECENDMVRA